MQPQHDTKRMEFLTKLEDLCMKYDNLATYPNAIIEMKMVLTILCISTQMRYDLMEKLFDYSQLIARESQEEPGSFNAASTLQNRDTLDHQIMKLSEDLIATKIYHDKQIEVANRKIDKDISDLREEMIQMFGHMNVNQ